MKYASPKKLTESEFSVPTKVRENLMEEGISHADAEVQTGADCNAPAAGGSTVQMASGKTAPQACKEARIHTQTYYRWRKEYGGLKVEQAKRMKELEKENTQLKRLLAELSLEKQVLKDVAEGNF